MAVPWMKIGKAAGKKVLEHRRSGQSGDDRPSIDTSKMISDIDSSAQYTPKRASKNNGSKN